MKEAAQNGKESSHSAHANGMNERNFIDLLTGSAADNVMSFICYVFIFPLRGSQFSYSNLN
jgi:hypothetical protein